MWITFAGLILLATFQIHQIKGGILIGIVIVTLFTWIVEKSFPSKIVAVPQIDVNRVYIDFSDFNVAKCFPAVASFLLVGIIDLGGVIFGMASLAKLAGEDGMVPGSSSTFLAASAGTIVGAALGSTPLIVYVESGAGIKEGGKTGLTAMVISGFFVIALVFAPLFGAVPPTATAPVSILVGAMMISQAKEIDWEDMKEGVPAFLTLIIMPITFSITNGIAFGLLASAVLHVTSGQLYTDIKLKFGEVGRGNGGTSSTIGIHTSTAKHATRFTSLQNAGGVNPMHSAVDQENTALEIVNTA